MSLNPRAISPGQSAGDGLEAAKSQGRTELDACKDPAQLDFQGQELSVKEALRPKSDGERPKGPEVLWEPRCH